jgi:peptidyl-prolyl cis-trans isomerase C
MARNHSECPSKGKGGDLGFFGRGSMVKPFEEVAFKLKKGEVGHIVETQFGFHLIKLVDRREAHKTPLEQARDTISAHLKTQKQSQALSAYLDELRQNTKINYAEGAQQN